MRNDLFSEAYPLIRRAARVRSAVLRALRAEALDPDDLEQEAVLAVLRRLGRFDPLRASLPTFVERVVSTTTTSLLRKGAAQKRIYVDPHGGAVKPSRISVVIERRVDISRVLGRLSRPDQNVARLLLLADKPAEIARKLGCSRTSVYRSTARIRSALESVNLGKT